eukprot:10439370-Prorocentrum_lima.AAC.1
MIGDQSKLGQFERTMGILNLCPGLNVRRIFQGPGCGAEVKAGSPNTPFQHTQHHALGFVPLSGTWRHWLSRSCWGKKKIQFSTRNGAHVGLC